MTTPSRALLVLVLALLQSGCGDDSSGPKTADPGLFDLVLTSPNDADAALLVRLTGPGIDSVTTLGTESRATTSGNTTTLLIRGTVSTGVIARVAVPDRNKGYSAVLLQAVERTSYRQRALGGYVLRLRKP